MTGRQDTPRQKRSERAALQDRIAEFLQEHKLDQVYGVIRGRQGRGRGSYRSLTFCLARAVDGEIRIFGPRFILVRSNRCEQVCRSEAEVLQHLRTEYLGQGQENGT